MSTIDYKSNLAAVSQIVLIKNNLQFPLTAIFVLLLRCEVKRFLIMVCVMVLHFMCDKGIIPNAFACKAGERKRRSLSNLSKMKWFFHNCLMFFSMLATLMHTQLHDVHYDKWDSLFPKQFVIR